VTLRVSALLDTLQKGEEGRCQTRFEKVVKRGGRGGQTLLVKPLMTYLFSLPVEEKRDIFPARGKKKKKKKKKKKERKEKKKKKKKERAAWDKEAATGPSSRGGEKSLSLYNEGNALHDLWCKPSRQGPRSVGEGSALIVTAAPLPPSTGRIGKKGVILTLSLLYGGERGGKEPLLGGRESHSAVLQIFNLPKGKKEVPRRQRH